MKDTSKVKKIIKKIIRKIFGLFLILLIIYNLISILEIEDIFKKMGYDIIVVDKYQAQKKIKENTMIISKTKNNKYSVDDLIVVKVSNSEYFRRIVNIDLGLFTTKSDDSHKVDQKMLKVDEIEGKVIAKIPFLGAIFRFARTGIFSVLVLIYIFIYFAYSNHINKKQQQRRKKQKRMIKTNPQNSIN